MNKNTHRLIFNASRSCMMAVAETVGSCSKSRSTTSSARSRSSKCRKTPESSSIYLSNKPVAQVICAQAAPELIVKTGNSAALTADGQVNLLAATNTSSQASTNSNSSSSVGVSYSALGGWGFNASASKGQGKSDGQDTSYTNTQIAAGNIASIKSGADTNIKGAVITANTIKADVGQQFGGSLSIESLQDQSSYTSKQSSSGGSISVGGGSVTGGSISASKSNINSTFQSVNQQSGLKAGDGGFQVSVANNTDLKGGAITSTQKAVDSKANTFSTGGQLSTTDVQNTASYKGEAVGGTIGVGSQLSKSGAGTGNTQGSAASTSSAGISGIAGNTAVRTSDKEAGLKPIFNADKAQKEIDAQVKITTSFGQQASKSVGNYAGNKLKDAIAKGDQAEIDKWKEGGSARVGLHTLVGLLTGNVSGAVGAGVTQSVIPYIGEQIAKLGVPLELKQALIQVASGVIGAAAGGPGGAASGLNATSQNYLNHPDATKLLALQKKHNDGTLTPQEKQERDALIQKDATTTAQLNGCAYSTSTACQSVKADFQQAQQSFLPSQAEIQKWATDKAPNSPYSAAQLTDAYNFAFTKGAQPPAQSSTGNLSGAYDWIVKDLSDSAKTSGAPVLDKMYMGWATANAPSVAGGVTSAIIGGQALLTSGVKVSTLPALNKPPAPTAEEVSAAAKAKIDNNVYAESGRADPARAMSATGPWKPASELTPLQANGLVNKTLPPGANVGGSSSADAANAAFLKDNPRYQAPFMPGTQITEFTAPVATQYVRLSGGKSDPTANWIMKSDDIAGLSPIQIASKFGLPEVPTQIGAVTIPAGQPLQASVANGILRGDNPGGGGVQFYIPVDKAKLPADWFGMVRPLK